MSQANTQGAGISPHVLQMGELGQAPEGRGRACGGHCCRQVRGRGLQGVTLVHPSLLLPQEGPRHGQMVLLGGVPWASTQPAPTAPSADPVALSLRPPPPKPGRHCACSLGEPWLWRRALWPLLALPGSRRREVLWVVSMIQV